eukprot:362936-Chlamydomonas_euryale.AAC.8
MYMPTGKQNATYPNWEELVGDMNASIAVTIVAKGVKPELFYSMDDIFTRTYEERGAKSVTVSDELRGATIAFTIKLTDEIVAMMVIHAGATQASTPGRERQVSDDAKRICAYADAAGHVMTVSADPCMTKGTYKQGIEEIMLQAIGQPAIDCFPYPSYI